MKIEIKGTATLLFTGLVYFIIISSSLFAQDTIRKKRFYIGAFGSPDYSYRILPVNNTGKSGSDYIISNRNSFEIPKIAFTAGLDFLYQLNKRLAISAGVQYSVKGEKTKYYDLEYGNGVGPNSAYIVNGHSVPAKVRYNYNTRYIDIPIRIDFYLSKKKIAPFITTGISTNILINEKVLSTATYLDGHSDKYTSTGRGYFSSINPQFQLGFGADATFKKSRLRIFPIYRMSFIKMTSGSIKDYYYSIGLGINYFFGL